jgi:cell volume regulation protein A
VEQAHDLILLGGVLGLIGIFAGLVSAQISAPLLLVFLAIGILAGEEFYEAFAWLAQVTLFLMLGLLVTPHDLIPAAGAIAVVAAVLILLARPLAAFVCLLPFGYGTRQSTFAAWVRLRGALPIYLTIIPVLSGAPGATAAKRLLGIAFGTVAASLVAQGWTVRQAATLLGFGPKEG